MFPAGTHGYALGLPYGQRHFENGAVVPGQMRQHREAAVLLGASGAQGEASLGVRTISCLEFYRHQLHLRTSGVAPSTWDPHFHPGPMAFGDLSQEYAVSAYTKVEDSKLLWIRYNQDKLRADLYSTVSDRMEAGLGIEGMGQRVILPASTGLGQRAQTQNYRDAAAICNGLGHPQLFITFTANPTWPEVVHLLRPGEKAFERPDLVARIFKLKLKAFLEDVTGSNHIFLDVLGKCTGYTYTIEFQKRGLPHAHIVIWYERQIDSERIVNTITLAQLPHKDLEPRYFEAVTTLMMHGPCGAADPHKMCMVDGQCSKNYPKTFCAQTELTEGNGVRYARPDNSRHVIKCVGGAQVALDNRSVVPHNRTLLLCYNAHINVEVCARAAAVKYLFKYIYKGQDRAIVQFEQDEIKQFINARYLSPSEALWHLFGFSMHECHPAVVRLPVHEQNNQRVVFPAAGGLQMLQHILRRAERTMLLQYFAVSEVRARRNLSPVSYVDIPSLYSWNTSERMWVERQQQQRFTTIGRMSWIPVSAGEQFFLRSLLLATPGATSYDFLRTVNGHLYPSFRDACMARNLVHDESVWDCTMRDAINSETSAPSLRALFLLVIVHGGATDPLALWHRYAPSLADDFRYQLCRMYPSPEAVDLVQLDAITMCLTEIRNLLPGYGDVRALLTALPSPGQLLLEAPLAAPTHNAGASDLTVEQAQDMLDDMVPQLNVQQRLIFDTVCRRLEADNEQPFIVIIDAPGGFGKTFLAKLLLAAALRLDTSFIASAATGIASLLLPGGATTHKAYGIPLDLDATSMCGFSIRSSDLCERVMAAGLHVADECSMLSRHGYEGIDRSFRDAETEPHKRDLLIAGRLMVFMGDARQLPPVADDRAASVALSAFKSYLFDTTNQNIVSYQLTLNERVRRFGADNPDAQRWCDFLLAIGGGYIEPVHGDDWIALPRCIVLPPDNNSIESLCAHVYPGLSVRATQALTSQADMLEFAKWVAERALLATLNVTTRSLSLAISNLLPGVVHHILSSDGLQDPNADPNDLLPLETLHAAQPPGFPPHCLSLRPGDCVSILRNLNPVLKNGVRCIVLTVSDFVLNVMVASGADHAIGSVHILSRIKFIDTRMETGFSTAMFRIQFPVALSWAMTINKSQGQTLRCVGIYLKSQCFAHGQLYVALSRCPSISGVRVLAGHFINNAPVTRNVVWPELLPPGRPNHPFFVYPAHWNVYPQ